MNKKFEWITIIVLTVILIGLSACTQSPHETKAEMNAEITKNMEAMDKEKAEQDIPGPSDFEAIAEILGCMFAPDECIPEKRKAEKEMDR
tara:strand:- start:826 stop:1095 length:270 start_codon:yes stop_codon:yes gene_type:complete